jgi:hypothetical protein
MPLKYVREQFFLVAKVMRDDSGAKAAAPTDATYSRFTYSLLRDEFHGDISDFFAALVVIDYLWHEYYITRVVI